MDNEKYGIELELITDSFNKQINKVKEQAKSVKKAFDPNDISGLQIFKNGKPWEEYENGIEKVNQKTRQLISITKGTQIAPKYDQSALNFIDNYGVKQEQASQKTKKTTENVKELNRETKKTGKGLTLDGFNKGLDKMTSKIRRFGLSLLSIRSIWSLVSRASSAYLAQDTELANKLQSVWAGLGAMLAPIIEGIVNILAKAVKYINIFIKALTGVDLLARATSKSMNGTAKSAKALNKALAGFDELQNLDTDAGGGADIGGGLGGLQDVEINTEWAEKIQRFGEWVKANWPEVLALLGGLATLFMTLNPMITQFGLGLGIIKALGIGVMIGGIVLAVSSLIAYLSDPSWNNFGKIITGIGIAIAGLGAIIGGLPVIVAGAVVAIFGLVISNWQIIKDTLQKGINWLVEKSDWVHHFFGDFIGGIYDFFVQALQNGLNYLDAKFTSIKGQFDGIIEFIKGVFTGDWERAWNGIKQGFSAWWEGIKGMFKSGVVDMGKSVGNLIANSLKAVVNGILAGVENILNKPIRAINSLISIINNVPRNKFGKIKYI